MRSTRFRLLLVVLFGLSLGACGGGGAGGGGPADDVSGAPVAPGGPPDLSGFVPEVITMPDLAPRRAPGSSRYLQTRGGTAVYVENVGNATAPDSHVTVYYRDGGRTFMVAEAS